MSLYARIRRRLCFSFLALHDMQEIGDYQGHESELVIWKPRSIAFHKLGHAAFCELNSTVDEILKTEIGLSGDELLNERQDDERTEKHERRAVQKRPEGEGQSPGLHG
jgi:hypothetical protein